MRSSGGPNSHYCTDGDSGTHSDSIAHGDSPSHLYSCANANGHTSAADCDSGSNCHACADGYARTHSADSHASASSDRHTRARASCNADPVTGNGNTDP